jgi:hypothetical protein
MNPLKADAQSRCKDNIASIRRIYLDIDRDGHNTLLRINTDSKEGRLPAPAYVLNTSPNKYQIIWNVQGFTQEIAEGTMRSLVRLYNGDPAAVDISRVLRLPGLHNKKYGQTFPIVALPYSRKVYSPAEFPEPTCTPVASPRHATRSHSSGGIDTSPSGKEFAYCCHEIYHAPAHDLEAVCSRLTDEIEQRARARKKNTSDYRGYAERTVTNARQKIAFAQRHIL